jgi:hypothetical protein
MGLLLSIKKVILFLTRGCGVILERGVKHGHSRCIQAAFDRQLRL